MISVRFPEDALILTWKNKIYFSNQCNKNQLDALFILSWLTNKLRINSASSWFLLHWSIEMHGQQNRIFCLYIHGSVHRDSILIRSNEMQQYVGIYLLQNYSTCFGCISHPSSGIHQTVTVASGTGLSVRATNFRQRGLIRPRWRKVVALIRDMTCTRSCSYSFMYSWWWAR